MNFKAARRRDFRLAFFDLGVVKLLDVAALYAHQMIVVTALIELEHRFVGFKVVAYQEASLLELQQYAVDSCQPRVSAVFLQQLVDVFGGEVAHGALLEKFEDAQAWQGGLQAAGFEILG